MPAESLQIFEQQRRRLTGLAYRMLGAVSDAEDVVQDAWLRWQRVEPTEIANPQAWLSTVVTRLCLDRLKEARRRRETYVGAWLPEPLLEDPELAMTPEAEVGRDVSFALMLALERLSPLERAAFILHDVFELDFAEVAAAVERSEAACRQLASRARGRLRAERPRFAPSSEERDSLVQAFLEASRSGDTQRLQGLLSESAVLHSDGGGRKPAALNPILGREKICRFFAGLVRKDKTGPPRWTRRTTINGLPGCVSVEADGTLQTSAFEIADGRIVAIYTVRNPDKLTHLLPLLEAEGLG
ncbi:MAG: sigma-70 family RNA polymerase sigma factor [Pseudomonadota bacterium]